jgi:hypothetical protein
MAPEPAMLWTKEARNLLTNEEDFLGKSSVVMVEYGSTSEDWTKEVFIF